MQPRLDRSEWRPGDAGNFIERKILHKMEQQHGTMRPGQLVQQFHELRLLFLANEQFSRPGADVRVTFILRIEGNGLGRLLAPLLNAFLMGDAEEPRAEPSV